MMKLSLQFISSQLPYKSEVINEKEGLKYSGITIYSSSVKPEDEVLYLSLSGEMPQSCQGMVVIGEKPSETEIPMLWVCEAVDPVQVFHEIFSIFRKFYSWSEKITDAVAKRKPLEEIMQLTDEVTPNPWYLTDHCFRTCAMRDDPLFTDVSAFWRYQHDHGHMAFDRIYKLISSGDMARMNAAADAIIFRKTEAFNMPFVSKTIFSAKGIVGHFFIIGLHNILSCYELEIADYLCQSVSILLDYDVDSFVAARGFYDYFFIDLIEGNEVKAKDTKELLQTLNWSMEDEYIVCVMKIVSSFEESHKLNAITVYEIEETLPSKAFLYEEKLVFIVNAALMEQNLVEKLKMIARKCESSIGYSDIFKGMQQFPAHYQQALLAVEHACQDKQDSLVRSYASISVPHMLNQIVGNLSEDFILHPAVSRLEEYDAKNHTELLRTIYVYLKNERRTLETVKELFIHRNSLLYRLERIQEITGFQMEDYQERLRMLISCEIYFN